MPAFGLGTGLSKRLAVGTAVEVAIKGGYRLLDCAHIYGNEVEIGKALRKCFTEGVVKREDLFISSKLWCTDHGRADVLPACETTLRHLQLDYLDLYLVHWPFGLKKGSVLGDLKDGEDLGYDEEREANCWEGMEELIRKGLVKAIGISNYSITKIENLLKTAEIVPAVNQVECQPYLQQDRLKEYCDSQGIVFEAYSPLGNPGNPFRTGKEPNLLEDPVIKEIARKHKISAAQVCIAFPLHRGMVVIPKSVTPSRITENFKATEVKLDAEDMRRLRALKSKKFRFELCNFLFLNGRNLSEDIWDTIADKGEVDHLQS